MKRNIIAFIMVLTIITVFTITVFAVKANSAPLNECKVATVSEDYIPSEPVYSGSMEPTIPPIPEETVIILDPVVVERVEPTAYHEANALLEEALARQALVTTIYENFLALGYAKDHPAVVMSKTDMDNTQTDVEYYQEKYNEFEEYYKWEMRAEEYPVATQVWLHMKNELGWSDIVCAGVMGNIMAECAGGSFYFDWDVSGSSGYGMIQWLGGRRDLLFSLYGSTPGIEDQLNYVRDELYGINGVRPQVTESQLDAIINAESPEDCAFAFATYFERCASEYRSMRRGYARTAYEYFAS